ncbi:MAG TPA: hypothetical protein VEG36_11525 [Burkholderiales bacterium]|nr:hypothetical protein [Burkholderiales bacterium]
MTSKKTELERLKAASITDRMSKARTPDRFGKGSAAPSRREQRRLDQAQGLVPFAVKLPAELVNRVRARAEARQAPLHEVVAELLEKGLS